MDCNFRQEIGQGVGDAPSSESSQFAQALLGKSVPNASQMETDSRPAREDLAWLAEVSPEHESLMRGLLKEQNGATAPRAQLEWLADISARHESELRRLLADDAHQSDGRFERLVEGADVQEAKWDPSKHPRRGGPPNAGWFARKGGGRQVR